MRARLHTRSRGCVHTLAPFSAFAVVTPARCRVVAVSLSLAGFLGGCSTTPPSLPGPDASNPAVHVRPASYRSSVDGYASQRPVAPGNWRQQNERVAPSPKSGE